MVKRFGQNQYILDPSNQKLFNDEHFDITPERPYIIHPCDENFKLFITYDEIHMYKTMVNHFRDDECQLPNDMTFNRSDFLDLVEKRGSAEISFGSHLKLEEINFGGQDRQNVAAALHIVSNDTADLFDYFYPPKHPDHLRKSEISKMCRAMHNMHLVMSANRWDDVSNPLHAPLGTLIECIPRTASLRDSFSHYL